MNNPRDFTKWWWKIAASGSPWTPISNRKPSTIAISHLMEKLEYLTPFWIRTLNHRHF
ncbi:hypothetical protein [Serratia fonticola]|uniref:Uncharacterized protein n=1 Tax=Serratia fonticola TaxID=47917 RepID=A0A4U9U3Y6_SERFO|nr:hypothetical protein [Serratia fonticola]CAI1767718.1 Uncharacterised protein [Serratia fonticola]VTR23694.1 Uncharacterised protein [Serratia fonticola]